MPRYKVWQSWQENTTYSNHVEIEADSEEEARELADADRCMDDGDSQDSSYERNSFSVDDIEEIEGTRKNKRNLPQWF